MTNINEVEKAVHLLMQQPDCLAWLEFGDRGNAFCGPFKLETQEEIIEDALALACVKIVMPKGSAKHIKLANSIARLIGCQYVTYDWFIKIVGRIVAVSSYQDFCNMLSLSIVVKDGMKQRGLTKIQQIEEMFA